MSEGFAAFVSDLRAHDNAVGAAEAELWHELWLNPKALPLPVLKKMVALLQEMKHEANSRPDAETRTVEV
jgi:hypothetical protein